MRASGRAMPSARDERALRGALFPRAASLRSGSRRCPGLGRQSIAPSGRRALPVAAVPQSGSRWAVRSDARRRTARSAPRFSRHGSSLQHRDRHPACIQPCCDDFERSGLRRRVCEQCEALGTVNRSWAATVVREHFQGGSTPGNGRPGPPRTARSSAQTSSSQGNSSAGSACGLLPWRSTKSRTRSGRATCVVRRLAPCAGAALQGAPPTVEAARACPPEPVARRCHRCQTACDEARLRSRRASLWASWLPRPWLNGLHVRVIPSPIAPDRALMDCLRGRPSRPPAARSVARPSAIR